MPKTDPLKFRKLDIGCGRKKVDGAFGIDISREFTDCNMEVDLESKNWPLPESHFEKIYANNVLAYISDVRNFFDNVHRIAKNDAKVLLIVPYFKNPAMWGNLYHKRGYASLVFLSEDLKGRFRLKYARLNFSATEKSLYGKMMNNAMNRMKWLYENTILSSFFPAYDIKIELSVVK